MKILQINKFHYRHGGSETVYFNTTELLRAKGHNVIHFSMVDDKNLDSTESAYFVNMPNLRQANLVDKIKHSASFLYNTQSAKNLEQLILAEKPDIVHIHLLFNGMSVSILPILKKHKIPTVMTVHDYRLICPASTFLDKNGNICEACKGKNYYHCTIKRCSQGNPINSLMLSIEGYFRDTFFPIYKYIDRFIFVSDFSLRKHEQFIPRYESKSEMLFNFTTKKTKIEHKFGGYFLYLGRLSIEKGIPSLLKVAKDLPHCSFVIAGSGPLRSLVEEYDGTNLNYVGFKTGDELNKIIEEASWIIVPSEWYENNPLAVIEPFSMGKPVIGANIGGISELIKDDFNGFLFESRNLGDLESKIIKAATLGNNDYAKLSINAKQFADLNLSPDYHYDRLISIYNSIIK
jgi:glycosyltransferase involved in cell wall biosynthesis